MSGGLRRVESDLAARAEAGDGAARPAVVGPPGEHRPAHQRSSGYGFTTVFNFQALVLLFSLTRIG